MVVIIMAPLGEAKDDLNNIVQEIQMEMQAINEQFALTVGMLVKTQRQLLELKTKNFQ